MSARLRRLEADYDQIKTAFSQHPHIRVNPIGGMPPERYHVIYKVNGIYLKEDRTVENIKQHEIDIILHSDYPRYKPVVKIQTPIFHPNFNDGQVCIGDIWGAGETLTDIIINIGNMIQYQSWNSYSPLSSEAASWAIKNKYLFPVGNLDLYPSEEKTLDMNHELNDVENTKHFEMPTVDQEYIMITKDELKDVKFVPSAERMQSLINSNNIVDNKKINFETILKKGIVWGLIGGVLGWLITEISDGATSSDAILEIMGYNIDSLIYMNDFNQALSIIQNSVRISTAIFISLVSGSIGAFMGYGEGYYYGSKENAKKFAVKGLWIALGLGFVFGYIAQIMYSSMLTDYTSDVMSALIRGIAWSAAGLGAGISIGLIKSESKRIIYTSIGGLVGGFIGGSIFNVIASNVSLSNNDTGILPRLIGISIMGALIGSGVGLLEQFAKSAWLKVIRGEFEGKEYLVFSGTTSIGRIGANSIVLFKDKAVDEHHCEIVQEGSKYVLIDSGSSQGTFINGNRVKRHVLSKGDAIGVGNTVLIFNVKEA